MLKFITASDSFKESLSAKAACQAIAEGIKRVFPDAEVVQVPMADGGEGTVDAILSCVPGEKVAKEVTGPDGKRVLASYGLINDGKCAVIETAAASGLGLVEKKDRNPMTATTFGTGELVLDALKRGVKKVIVGLGGSATNDGGAGLAQALGVKFLDKNGKDLPFGGGSLGELAKIDASGLDLRLKEAEIILASDVTNPLTGPNGASAVFGPQKGADKEMVQKLDANLHHYAAVIKEQVGKDIENLPGSGAAGGLGAGFLAFSKCQMKAGAQIVIEESHLAEKMRDADYVFTGEGGIDFQTKFGKTPYAVAQVAKKFGIPVFALAGQVGDGIDSLYDAGFTAIFGILPGVCSLPEALAGGGKNLARTSENVARVIKAAKTNLQ
ncbi:glycerate kinase family protein [Lactobacillus sp.]|uniref:glycerate kinase family protein n=1 Tax=Lactobacillus sp. TaxID=1591 RepID=UPI003EFE5394